MIKTPSRIEAIPFPLHRVQLDFRRSTKPIRAFTGGIGCGKSKIGAYDLLQKAKGSRFYMIAAPTYPMLRDTTARTFEEVSRYLRRLVSINRSEHTAKIRCLDGGIADVTMRSTQDPEHLRGPTLSGVLMDEASLMRPDVETIMLGRLREGGELGWMSMVFTPKGKRNWTYSRLVKQKDPNVDLFSMRTADSPFLAKEYVEQLQRRYPAYLAAQELEGQFVDDADQLITYEQMMNCTDTKCLWHKGNPPANDKHGLLYIGWDLGRKRHRSVIWTWERVGDVAVCRECYVMHNVSYEVQREEFKRRVMRPNVQRAMIDRGIAGGPFADEFSRLMGRRFEGVSLSGYEQGYLAEQLALAFENRRVRIPDNSDIRNDFALVGKPEQRGGKSFLPAEQVDEDAELGHADRFWAAALAYKGFTEHKPMGAAGIPMARTSSLVNGNGVRYGR